MAFSGWRPRRASTGAPRSAGCVATAAHSVGRYRAVDDLLFDEAAAAGNSLGVQVGPLGTPVGARANPLLSAGRAVLPAMEYCVFDIGRVVTVAAAARIGLGFIVDLRPPVGARANPLSGVRCCTPRRAARR